MRLVSSLNTQLPPIASLSSKQTTSRRPPTSAFLRAVNPDGPAPMTQIRGLREPFGHIGAILLSSEFSELILAVPGSVCCDRNHNCFESARWNGLGQECDT